MNQLSITLPLPNPKLHAHNTGNWRAKAGPTRTLRNMAKLLTTAEQRGKRIAWQSATVTYRFYFKDNRRRDTANCIQSMKPAIDGVVDSGLIPDDAWQYLSIAGVECEIDKANPRTELIFERRD